MRDFDCSVNDSLESDLNLRIFYFDEIRYNMIVMFTLDKFEKGYTTVFLGNKTIPTNLLLLKRRANVVVAPNLYTGVGGKIEQGESPMSSAIRELEEETSLNGYNLSEFARLIINNKRIYFFFYGIYELELIPKCTEGIIKRVDVAKIYDQNLIPTSATILQEWERRNWKVVRPFTIYVDRDDIDNVFATVREISVRDGLHF